VAVDRDKLVMAVTHAVRNAQDATPADGSIEVSVHADGNRIRIDVSDTGSGMDAEFLRSELFKPFHSTKGAKGMGIGAYQIRETMRSAGGDVEVRSAIGAGTTFCMWLPAAPPSVMLAGQSAA
jgi:signal transduction histidine kinase